MSRKLHIANLRFAVTHEDLGRLFAPYGAVRSAHVMSYLKTACGAASGIVEMDSDEHASAAVAALNGLPYRGQVLTVGWASERQEKSGHQVKMFESMNVPDDDEPHAAHDNAGRGGNK